MLRNLLIFGICAGSSALIPIVYQSNPDLLMGYLPPQGQSEPISETLSVSTAIPAAKAQTSPSTSGRRVNLVQDARGHFQGEFKLNGRKVDALVDTGATAVAINLSTARRIGIAISLADMKRSVSTANGDARAGVVMIDRLDIGRISVENVEAVVLEDAALSGTLIGMTFLNRLKRFGVDNGAMVLVQ